MTRTPWTNEDTAVLLAAYPDTPTQAIAQALARSGLAGKLLHNVRGEARAPLARRLDRGVSALVEKRDDA